MKKVSKFKSWATCLIGLLFFSSLFGCAAPTPKSTQKEVTSSQLGPLLFSLRMASLPVDNLTFPDPAQAMPDEFATLPVETMEWRDSTVKKLGRFGWDCQVRVYATQKEATSAAREMASLYIALNSLAPSISQRDEMLILTDPYRVNRARENEYMEVFQPSRVIMKRIPEELLSNSYPMQEL